MKVSIQPLGGHVRDLHNQWTLAFFVLLGHFGALVGPTELVQVVLAAVTQLGWWVGGLIKS